MRYTVSVGHVMPSKREYGPFVDVNRSPERCDRLHRDGITRRGFMYVLGDRADGPRGNPMRAYCPLRLESCEVVFCARSLKIMVIGDRLKTLPVKREFISGRYRNNEQVCSVVTFLGLRTATLFPR